MLRQASVENQRSMLGLASQGTTGESQLRGRIAAMYAGELSSRNAAGQAAAARVQEQNQRDQFAAQAMANLGQQGANLWGIGNQAEQATAQLDQNERKWQAELEFAWARFRAAQGAAEKNRWWMVATAIMSAIGAGVGAYVGGPKGATAGAQLGANVGDFAQSLYDEQAFETGGGLSRPSPGAGGGTSGGTGGGAAYNPTQLGPQSTDQANGGPTQAAQTYAATGDTQQGNEDAAIGAASQNLTQAPPQQGFVAPGATTQGGQWQGQGAATVGGARQALTQPLPGNFWSAPLTGSLVQGAAGAAVGGATPGNFRSAPLTASPTQGPPNLLTPEQAGQGTAMVAATNQEVPNPYQDPRGGFWGTPQAERPQPLVTPPEDLPTNIVGGGGAGGLGGNVGGAMARDLRAPVPNDKPIDTSGGTVAGGFGGYMRDRNQRPQTAPLVSPPPTTAPVQVSPTAATGLVPPAGSGQNFAPLKPVNTGGMLPEGAPPSPQARVLAAGARQRAALSGAYLRATPTVRPAPAPAAGNLPTPTKLPGGVLPTGPLPEGPRGPTRREEPLLRRLALPRGLANPLRRF